MSGVHRKVIDNNLVQLMDLTCVSPRLLLRCTQERILTRDQSDEINVLEIKYKRVKQFYEYIWQGSTGEFRKMIKIMEEEDTKQSDDVLLILKGALSESSEGKCAKEENGLFPCTNKSERSGFGDCTPTKLRFNRVLDPVDPFCGRSKEIAAIRSTLDSNKCALISGLGGIGKSELTRKYVSVYQADYDGIVYFKIDSECISNFTQSIYRLAEDYLSMSTVNGNGNKEQITSVIHKVLDELTKYVKSKCLIIFDNVDLDDSYARGAGNLESDDDIRDLLIQFVRPERKLHFIVTSRDQSLKVPLTNSTLIEIPPIPDVDAADFLRKSLFPGGISTSTGSPDTTSDPDIQGLCEVLEGLPLSFQHAIAYIKRKQEEALKLYTTTNAKAVFTIRDYLNDFKFKATALLGSSGLSKEQKSVLITWDMTMEHILCQGTDGQAAITLLGMLAYSRAGKPFSTELLMRSRTWLNGIITPKNSSVSGEMDDDDTIGSIILIPQKYSMFKVHGGKIHMHGLLQLVIRTHHERELIGSDYIRRLLDVFGEDFDVANLPHVVSAWTHCAQFRNVARKYNRIGTRLGDVLLNELKSIQIGNDLVVAVFNVALVTRSSSFEELLFPISVYVAESLLLKHPDSTVLHNLKAFYKLSRDLLGPTNEFTLMGMSGIAYCLQKQGVYVQALNGLQALLTQLMLCFKKNDPNVLHTMLRIANIHILLKSYSEAIQICEWITKMGIKAPLSSISREYKSDEEKCQFYYQKAMSIVNVGCQPEIIVRSFKLFMTLVADKARVDCRCFGTYVTNRWMRDMDQITEAPLHFSLIKNALTDLISAGYWKSSEELWRSLTAICESMYGYFAVESFDSRDLWNQCNVLKEFDLD